MRGVRFVMQCICCDGSDASFVYPSQSLPQNHNRDTSESMEQLKRFVDFSAFPIMVS